MPSWFRVVVEHTKSRTVTQQGMGNVGSRSWASASFLVSRGANVNADNPAMDGWPCAKKIFDVDIEDLVSEFGQMYVRALISRRNNRNCENLIV